MKIDLKLTGIVLACVIGTTSASEALTVPFEIFSAANSVGGGTGLATGINLTAGDPFQITVDPEDTWSLGNSDPSSRESTADGLPAYGNFDFGSFSALYGTLVGRIGAGDFFLIGTSFIGPANSTGELLLYNWDSNTSDNTGSLLAQVTTDEGVNVPLPPALLLLGSGLLGLGAARRWSKGPE
jgi:hypothetical protein